MKCNLLPQNERKVAGLYTEIYSLLNKKNQHKFWILLHKTRSYTHISYIISELALWKIWIHKRIE